MLPNRHNMRREIAVFPAISCELRLESAMPKSAQNMYGVSLTLTADFRRISVCPYSFLLAGEFLFFDNRVKRARTRLVLSEPSD